MLIKGMAIRLGGMGEGWAIDKVYEILTTKKIAAGYIDSSGGVRAWGKRAGGKLWTISVGNPSPMGADRNADASKVYFRFYGTDVAVTTAGDARKGFVKDEKRYHHIINPKTFKRHSITCQIETSRSESNTTIDNRTFLIFLDREG